MQTSKFLFINVTAVTLGQGHSKVTQYSFPDLYFLCPKFLRLGWLNDCSLDLTLLFHHTHYFMLPTDTGNSKLSCWPKMDNCKNVHCSFISICAQIIFIKTSYFETRDWYVAFLLQVRLPIMRELKNMLPNTSKHVKSVISWAAVKTLVLSTTGSRQFRLAISWLLYSGGGPTEMSRRWL